MCGITGIVGAAGSELDRSILERMTATLVHRGPDGGGVALPRPHVGFGHRRLAIIDLAGGAQPMAAAGGALWITFNGEIFNYRELRAELHARGRQFTTDSDTEVLLAVYELDGEDGLRRLEGQYAFAIHDARGGADRLVCARDPLGIKPLYWARTADGLLFGSEPRAILAHPAAPRALDEFALHTFLCYRFIPAPLSAWRGIAKLRPGELLTFEDGRLSLRRTWQPARAEAETVDDLDAARRDLDRTLHRAVERQKVADVPVGAFLSGGIDSSTMAALLARHSERRVATFTIGFAAQQYDESGFAAEVADHLGTAHVCERMEEGEASAVIGEILAHLDEPFGDPSLVPTWLLCKHAARHHKVVLSGDGGDELFGGYGRIYRSLGILEWPGPLRPLHRALARLRQPTRDPARWRGDDPRVDREYVRLLEDGTPRSRRALYGPALAGCLRAGDDRDPIAAAVERFRGYPPFSRVLLADLEAHLADYHLVKVERASMAHGLEVRVPFLDRELVELANTWTAGVRLHGSRSKGLLREVVAPLLPEVVMTRPKRGFGPPLKLWFKGGLGAFARESLLDGAAVQRGLLRRESVARLLDPARSQPKGSRIWRLLVLEHWLRGQPG